jgi:hypothetical protein
MAATTTIPIVFGIGEDPVKEGLVPRLDRPGANVTGATFFTALLGPKRLGLLRDLVPGDKVIGLLVNHNSTQGQWQIKDVQEAARGMITTTLMPLLRRRGFLHGNGRMAYASGGICGGARHRQPDQGQRRSIAHRCAQAAKQKAGRFATGPQVS